MPPQFDDVIEAELKYVRHMASLSAEQLQDVLDRSRMLAVAKEPDAHLMRQYDKQGRLHVGIFACPIELTHKTQFAREQHAPQRLSSLYRFEDHWEPKLRLKTICMVWFDCHYKLEFPQSGKYLKAVQ